MSIIDKVKSIFGYKSDKKYSLKEYFNLNDRIGITTQNCPYCNIELENFPSRKTKCKNCGNYMYIRTRPADKKKVIIKEDEIDLIQQEYDKILNNAKQKNFKNFQNISIDVSDDMKPIIDDLIKNYKDYCNYDEILQIDENDRLPILKYIWSRWAVRMNVIGLSIEYPQYDKNILDFIMHKEHFRVISLLKQKDHINMFKPNVKLNGQFIIQPFVEFKSQKDINSKYNNNIDSPTKLCMCYDMHNVYNLWRREERGYDHYSFFSFNHQITTRDLKNIMFWVDGEVKKLSPNDFLKYCQRYNIEYNLE